MIAAQLIVVGLLSAAVALYFWRLRTFAMDIIVPLWFVCAVLLVFQPTVATHLAHQVGIGRGADLIFYLAIPVLGLLILCLFARTRELNLKMTAIIREFAIANPRN